MVDVVGEGGVRVVNERALEPSRISFQHRVFVDETVFEHCRTASKQAQLGIGPEPAVFDPVAKEVVLAI